MSLSTARFIQLYGRAGYGAIAAIYTTVALLWLEYRLTVCTLVKVLARICWHYLYFLSTAIRAGDC